MKVLSSSLIIFLGVVFGYLLFDNAYIALAIGIGLYMAMNIWANDVANNVWPAVWSGTITLKQALIIAVIWEFSWAVIAGWDVVSTIKKWIIDISWVNATFWADWGEIFVIIMVSALLAWALWLNLATYLKAPVSTTHSIVWWVMGAWIASLWMAAVSWGTMWTIAASWVISPVLGWIIAALFLYWIKKTILFKTDMISASRTWVPFFVAIMSWSFSTYLILKWLKKIIKLEFMTASLVGFWIAICVFFIMKMMLANKIIASNTREEVCKLFTVPLVFSVLLLSFAHWANDVANAIGPMAAIYDTVMSGWDVSWKVWIPLWILAIWGFGLSIWLVLFGPRIIKTVWTEITKLDRIRAFAIALAASLTVIIASQLGLPVSSTHIAIWWVIGVWLLREYLDRKSNITWEKYVQRGLMWKIFAAWLITVPAAAFLAWSLFIGLKWLLL